MFSCRFCTYKTENLRNHLRHRKSYRHLTSAYYCGYHNCKIKFLTESSLRSHLIRSHKFYVSQVKDKRTFCVSDNEAKFICTVQICKKKVDNYKALIKHLKEHIVNELEVTCPYNGCDKKYKRVSSFTGHLTKKHRILTKTDDLNYNPDNVLQLNFLEEANQNLVPNNINENSSDEEDIIEDDELFIKALSTFYLKLECQYLIPESTIQYIVEELKILIEHEHKRIEQKLKDHFQKSNMFTFTPEVQQILKDVFQNNTNSIISKKMQTTFLRKQFYKSHFNFIWSKKKILANGQFLHYIPILETLKTLFYNKSLDFDINMPVQHENNLLKDFTDGNAFKSNTFFKENPNGLRLILYQDDFEVVTPIGSAKGKHVLTGVYLAIGNLPDYIRFQKNSIYLVALCKKKNFDHQAVFGEIVKDLKILESVGINIPAYGTIKGSLVFIAGDNLGSHTLGGFVDNFSRSLYFCRYCHLNKYEFYDENGECKIFENRTIDSYKNCLTKVKVNDETGEITSYYSVKFNSIFNNLLYYHVCNAGLPPCLGHDLMEGVITYDLALFINYFINQSWFTLSELNNMIDKFSYSKEDRKDKPLRLKPNVEKIRGDAWQIWTFLRLFPLIIINHIGDKDNEIWQCLLLLTEIIEIVCAPIIHTSYLPYLQTLIQNYFIMRKELFPDVRLRPKHHYMSHYPELINIYGPLIKVWTMRFESKHTFFKRVLRSCHNFKNITYTLSTKHEFLQSFCRLGGRYDLKNVNTSNRTKIFLNMYSKSLQNAVLRAHLELNLQKCETVSLKGTIYEIGNIVAVQQDSYQENVIMEEIRLILFDIKENIYFVIKTIKTKFRPHNREYEKLDG
ncbi:uncharacterized protein [Cardiocondyla obscurior]|uniref:uncharacterized protein n=1 Tax=Cardiocondyla obscurior TaxID=286306 RepID=UPI0039657B2F